MIIGKLKRSGRINMNNGQRAYLGIGAFAMSVGILTSQFADKSSWVFFGAALLGISMVLNIAGIVAFGKARRLEIARESAGNMV